MTTTNQNRSEEDALLGEGVDWIMRLTSGEADARDVLALAQWRARSPAHEAAFREAVRLRQGLKAASVQQNESRRLQGRRSGPQLSGVSRRVLIRSAIAASAVGAVAGAGFWGAQLRRPDFATRPGERRSIAPVPGLNLELNTRTRMNFEDVVGGYALDLLSGEVVASVVLGAGQTLAVSAAGGQAWIKSGEFNVRRDGDRVQLSCLGGTLSVRRGARSAMIGAGQEVVYDAQDFAVRLVDSAKVTAWRMGLLIFENRRLAEVIAEVNRYQTGRIVLLDESLGERPVNAVFRTDRLETVAPQIGQMLDLRVSQLPGGITVLR